MLPQTPGRNNSTIRQISRVVLGGYLLLLPWCGRAQDSTSLLAGFGVEATMLGGKVFKHEAKFTLPIPAFTSGADINFIWRTYGKKEWQQRRHYPRIGLAAAAIHYGMNSVYGNLYAVYPNITFPIISTPRMEWTLRLGNGVGYVTQKYSRTAPVNTVNVAISSSINDFIMIQTGLGYQLSNNWQLRAGAFVTHISNGSVRKPNLGVNVAGAFAGVSYYPVTAHPARISKPLTPLPNRYLVQLRYSMSLVSAYTNGGPLYPVYIGTGYISRRWRSHNKAFAGLDLSYHPSIFAHLRNSELEVGNEAAASYKSAVIAGNEFMMGRIGITLQAGVYIKRAYEVKDAVYEKVSLNYYCILKEHAHIKELFFFTGLKAHLNVAEMGEMGIGIGL